MHSRTLALESMQKTSYATWCLPLAPGNVDTFITQFKLLAEEGTYPLNTKLTLTLFVSKLSFKMMNHILKVVRPHHFQGWANVARQYHQDNMAVQNIKGIFDDTLHKSTYQQKKPNPTGFTPQQWAKILGVNTGTGNWSLSENIEKKTQFRLKDFSEALNYQKS